MSKADPWPIVVAIGGPAGGSRGGSSPSGLLPHEDPTQGHFNCAGRYVMHRSPPPAWPADVAVDTPRRLPSRGQR